MQIEFEGRIDELRIVKTRSQYPTTQFKADPQGVCNFLQVVCLIEKNMSNDAEIRWELFDDTGKVAASGTCAYQRKQP